MYSESLISEHSIKCHNLYILVIERLQQLFGEKCYNQYVYLCGTHLSHGRFAVVPNSTRYYINIFIGADRYRFGYQNRLLEKINNGYSMYIYTGKSYINTPMNNGVHGYEPVNPELMFDIIYTQLEIFQSLIDVLEVQTSIYPTSKDTFDSIQDKIQKYIQY